MVRVWTFKTARFTVALSLAYESAYQYDGDDKDGEIQAALDNGDMVAFDSTVEVFFDGLPVGGDSLGGSVYFNGRESEFWTAHRDPNPMNRNCSLNSANIGHYFPDMVREAVRAARDHLCSVPRLRCAA